MASTMEMMAELTITDVEEFVRCQGQDATLGCFGSYIDIGAKIRLGG